MDCPTCGCVRPSGHEPPCVDGQLTLLLATEAIGEEVPSQIPVSLYDVSGKLLELTMTGRSLTLNLKEEIFTHWRIPVACQKLFVGEEDEAIYLRDQDILSSYGSPLTVTMLLSLHVCFDESCSLDVRPTMELLSFLSEQGPKVKEQAVLAVAARLSHVRAEVRMAAVDALTKLARESEDMASQAASSVMEKINHESEHVRSTALIALAKVLPAGDAEGTRILTEHCGVGYHAAIRDAAQVALQEILMVHERGPSSTLLTLTRSPNTTARMAALRTLMQCSTKDNAEVLEAVCRSTYDFDDEVRREALEGLPLIAREGNARAIRAALGRLQDPIVDVVYQALRSLSQLCNKGREEEIRSVIECLNNRAIKVRSCALEVLLQIADASDYRIIKILKICAKSQDEAVCQRAQRELSSQKVSHVGSERQVPEYEWPRDGRYYKVAFCD